MKLLVGLGNPGLQYEKTRHNAGFLVIDELARRHAAGSVPRARFSAATVEADIKGQRCLLLKPLTYMNLSGKSVGEAVRFFKVAPATDLLIIVDECYLPFGSIRIREDGGAGGHNGLSDIERALGTQQYPRLRFGIDPKPAYMDQADYVLSRFSDEQQAALPGALSKAADAAEAFVTEGAAAAMNKFNTRNRPGEDREDSKRVSQ